MMKKNGSQDSTEDLESHHNSNNNMVDLLGDQFEGKNIYPSARRVRNERLTSL